MDWSDTHQIMFVSYGILKKIVFGVMYYFTHAKQQMVSIQTF